MFNSCVHVRGCFPGVVHADLTRRSPELDERKYLMGRGVVTETQSNMGKTEFRTGVSMCNYMYPQVLVAFLSIDKVRVFRIEGAWLAIPHVNLITNHH